MENKIKVIVGIEFTGLDNTFIKDNEIVQLKAMRIDNPNISVCFCYNSEKPISAYGQLSHKVEKYTTFQKFTKERFEAAMDIICDIEERAEIKDYEVEYYGFSPQQDKLMLAKYGIDIKINCIKEQMQLIKHEVRMATEGSSLECCYLIATGKFPKLQNHDGVNELKIIYELYQEIQKLEKSEYLTIMPFGHCAGMPLVDYVQQYRRAADGYRFNNNDLLSICLSYATDAVEEEENSFGEDEEYEQEYKEDIELRKNTNEENGNTTDDLPF